MILWFNDFPKPHFWQEARSREEPHCGMNEPENQGNTSAGGGDGDLSRFLSEGSAEELYPKLESGKISLGSLQIGHGSDSPTLCTSQVQARSFISVAESSKPWWGGRWISSSHDSMGKQLLDLLWAAWSRGRPGPKTKITSEKSALQQKASQCYWRRQ